MSETNLQEMTLLVEKWQVRPEPKWMELHKRKVMARLTPKRIFADGKTFDRVTGQEILARKYRVHAWYRHSVLLAQ